MLLNCLKENALSHIRRKTAKKDLTRGEFFFLCDTLYNKKSPKANGELLGNRTLDGAMLLDYLGNLLAPEAITLLA